MKKISLIGIVFLVNLAYASPENGSLNIKIKPQNIQAVDDFPYTLERKDKLLQLCLNYNYTQLGAYKVIDLKDFSTLKENKGFEGSSNPNNDFAMLDFIEKNAIFYKDNLPLHSDAITPPYNAIFARCMELYKSKKLTEFVNSLQPPLSLDNK